MSATSRLTDMWSGICCCHPPYPCISMGGQIITASSDTESSGLAQARLTDVTQGWCGHTGTIVTGSPNVFTNGLNDARIGDQVTGCNIGEIITGDSSHLVN